MGEAIITRRGGSGRGGAGEVIVEFESFTPSDTAVGFHPDGELVHSTPTALSLGRELLAGASVGNYALFAGGYDDGGYLDTVDAYSTDLVRSTPTALSARRGQFAGASVGDYALFAGGVISSYKDTVDAYNTDLVRSTPTALSEARCCLAGASVGNYALFAGGIDGSSTVDAYNTDLVRSTPTALTSERGLLAGVSVGNYALFAGGQFYVSDYNFRSTVDAYDTSLVHSTPTALSEARGRLAGASVGNYALFAGGIQRIGAGSSYYLDTVDAYNTDLVRSTPTALSLARGDLVGASVGNYALFAGGYGGGYRSIVDAYDASLVRSTPTALSEARDNLAGVSVGNYALFAGGFRTGKDTVDAYTPQALVTKLYTPIGTKYKFGESEEETATTNEITVPVPVTGYIKYKSGVVGTEGSAPDDS